ncbi:MAG: fructose-2,6-bisphosphatase [Solibacillus sp.]
MKKLVMLMMVMLVLAACGTKPSEPENNTQGSATKDKTIVLYKSDANAEFTMPFEEKYPSKDQDLVKFIFAKVNEHDVALMDYKFEQEDKSLVLNLGDDIYTIQGSAGASMFVETLVRSYFENFPELKEVTFIHKGSYEPILDHMMIGEPYKRENFKME